MLDYVRFKREVIEGLITGQEFRISSIHCQTMALEEYVTVVPRQLNIIEGVYSMHPTLIGYYDLKIFLSIDSERQSR